MLTPDQLAAIKARISKYTDVLQWERDSKVLLADYERLTRYNQRMSAALAQLSDKELWDWRPCEKMEGATDYIYCGSDDPQQLAERALVEDN